MRKQTANHDRSVRIRFRDGKKYLVLLLVIVAILVAPRHTRSQTPTPKASTTASAIPQRVVYEQVFKHVAFLDIQADLLDQRSGQGSGLRNYYQVHAALSNAETTVLKSTAHDAVVAVQAVDQQAHALVVAFRAQFANGRWPRGTPLPQPSPELKTLQIAKNNIVLNHLGALQTAFGSDRFQHFDNFVQTVIAPQITVSTVPKSPVQPPPPGGTYPVLPPVQWH
jgi:hypothetical protein